MDLSKAFDCIQQNLLIAKLESYGINENVLAYLHSYLSNRKRCMCINAFCLIAFSITSFILLKQQVFIISSVQAMTTP